MACKRKIVVTGCSSGIGAASATLLKQGGDIVIGVDINNPAAGTVDDFIHMDRSDSKSINSAVAELPGDIYGVVNSAVVTPILDDFLAAFGEVAAKRMEAIERISADEIAAFVQLLLNPAYELLNGSTITTEKGAVNLGVLSRLELA